ncbi:aspartyl-phosphate phosphatase Spo0E family protein [Paenibacillus alvei]|uniref:Aspartyl-phosphate phosphatase Spo0E family protein n=1 Tax=Paenibacillus alvei TaxID=44250 RepID=A0AAP7DKL6_PAEAL|nr:aspartyl-phosphate phosphatase Spo0E family protein [Paenibacillus alvei]NOJ74033.1 aspartyl-phosphate phosphatase Spo0E family protein [Paenibacillus alvei]
MISNCDKSVDALLSKIYELKQQLIKTAIEKKLTDDEVVKISQELDSYIVEVQRKQIKRGFIRAI